MIDGKNFEDEVRRVARLLWPSDSGGGAEIIAGKERDGIFISEECIHIIECTTSKSQKKAKEDGKKLSDLLKSYRKQNKDKAVKAWFITKHEPTPDQRSTIRTFESGISAVSYDTFRAKLINAKEYLEARIKYPFGSARNPDTGEMDDRSNYVQMELCNKNGELWSVNKIAESLLNSSKIVVLGDYGSGKSTTLREVFFQLRTMYFKNKTVLFPIILNLRDHHGQKDPAEALERHARSLGYPQPYHLVRAWRAGFALILLDGFDELGSPGWSGIPKKLKDLRFQSMLLVRKFINDTPNNVGLSIAGRAHYFDQKRELIHALGINDNTAITLNISDFTHEQVSSYLEKKGWKGSIPIWLPSRPLLLGYLAAKGVLGQTVNSDSILSPAEGWDLLLDRVCEREATVEIGISGDTVREIVERLASKARHYVHGLGPLKPTDISKIFRNCCGYDPDDKAFIFIQRLPGLAVADPEDGSRTFIDHDLVDVARAGNVISFIKNPFDEIDETYKGWQCTMSNLGIEIAAMKFKNQGFTEKQISAAIRRSEENISNTCLAGDLIQVLMKLGFSYTENNLSIAEISFNDFCLDSTYGDFSRISYRNCSFQEIEFDSDIDIRRMPMFSECIFGNVIGRFSEDDLPDEIFFDCEFCTFNEELVTTKQILDSDLSIPVKVGLTILKKIYIQSGSGRKNLALMRGLDHKEKTYVESVLNILKKEEFVIKNTASNNIVWLPVRKNASRVKKLLIAPTDANDPIISKLEKL